MNLDRNDIKMTTVSTEYYFNGNNVTCELVATLKAPEVFNAMFGFMAKCVKATAKCMEGDTYNEELGKKMALARAESKAYRQLANEMNRRWDETIDALETLASYRADFNAKAEKSIQHNDEYVKELPNKYN